mmetsp:Transcript_57372/g.100817  ORF Transcript_57372/g.100817 Transcript_57372/m.100817 type:complete len:138 (-) Transcript_57372:192-605(-)
MSDIKPNRFASGRDMVCNNCSACYYQIMSCHWCDACRKFKNKYGYDRPRHFWDDDFEYKCNKCNVALNGAKKKKWINKPHHDVKDLICLSCYKDFITERKQQAIEKAETLRKARDDAEALKNAEAAEEKPKKKNPKK